MNNDNSLILDRSLHRDKHPTINFLSETMSWLPGHPPGCQCDYCRSMTASSRQITSAHGTILNTSECTCCLKKRHTVTLELATPSSGGCYCQHTSFANISWMGQPRGFVSSIPATPLSSTMPAFDALGDVDLGSEYSYPGELDHSTPSSLFTTSDMISETTGWATQDDLVTPNTAFANSFGALGLMTPMSSCAPMREGTPDEGQLFHDTASVPQHQPHPLSFELDVDAAIRQGIEDSPSTSQAAPDAWRPSSGDGSLDFLAPENQSTDFSDFINDMATPAPTPAPSCASECGEDEVGEGREIVVNTDSLLSMLGDINKELEDDSDDDDM